MQKENHMRKDIKEIIKATAQKYECDVENRIYISEEYLKIHIKTPKPFDEAKRYWDFIMELADNIEEKVSSKNFYFEKWQRNKWYLILIFPKVEPEKAVLKREERELYKFLAVKLESAYAEYDASSTAEIYIQGREIQIWFDSEKPYLDKRFWALLNRVTELIEGRLNSEGYKYVKTQVLYDFVIWHYQKI